MCDQYKYDVALSFAGEERAYVEAVANYLKSNNLNVFYDYFEEANLWGKNLITQLANIYSYESKYCIIFISKNYYNKKWTNHESAMAINRMIESNIKKEEYILPVRFDDTELSGVLSTIAFIDANKKTPIELGDLVISKLRNEKNALNCNVTINSFLKLLISALTENLSFSIKVSNTNLDNEYRFVYETYDFNYYIKIIFDINCSVLLFWEGYAETYDNNGIPSAKIEFITINDLIESCQIYNLDFFDTIISDKVTTTSELLRILKENIFKKLRL